MESNIVKFCRSDAGLSKSEYAGESGTCVPVSLTHATKAPFSDVYERLFRAGWSGGHFELNRWLTTNVVNGIRFRRFNLMNDPQWIQGPYRIEDFCRAHGSGRYIVKSLLKKSTHTFYVENGVVYDTALCSGVITQCWRVTEDWEA